MHGAGNDFILLDCRETVPDNILELSAKLCDRHFGVGADGLLLLTNSEHADYGMRIINSDGSEAQMCGNGIRCLGKYVSDHGLKHSHTLSIETPCGVKELKLNPDAEGKVQTVTVDMGVPVVEGSDLEADTSSGTFRLSSVSTGNPHGVVITEDCDKIDIDLIGPQLECHEIWPDKANIEFITIISRHAINQRTWERGAGQTLACGTGAIASASAAVCKGLCDWPVKVHLLGGILEIDQDAISGHILMTGEAVEVFSGIIG